MGLEVAPFVQSLITQAKGTAAIYAAITSRLPDLRARLIDYASNLAFGPAALQANVGVPTEATRLYSEDSRLHTNIMADLDALYMLVLQHITVVVPPPPPNPPGLPPPTVQPPYTPPPTTPDTIAIIYASSADISGHLDPNTSCLVAIQNGTGRFNHAVLTVTQGGVSRGTFSGTTMQQAGFAVSLQSVLVFDGSTANFRLDSYDNNGGLMGTNTYSYATVVASNGSVNTTPVGTQPFLAGPTNAGPTTEIHWAPMPSASGYLLVLAGGAGSIGGPTNQFTSYVAPSANAQGSILYTYYVEAPGTNFAARFPGQPHVVPGYTVSPGQTCFS